MIQKHELFSTQPFLWSSSHIHTWLLEKPYFWLDGLLPAKWCLCFLICCLGWSWRRRWHPTPALLPGKSHGWRSLVGCNHGVRKSRTQLSDFTFTFHFHALEKAMATHSSVLAWRIPGTGETGRLPSMGSHRVGHDWSDLAAAACIDSEHKYRKTIYWS